MKKQVTDLNEKVKASDAAFVKVKGKSKDYKKNIKSLSRTMDQFIAKAARLASDLNEVRRADAQKGDQIAEAQTYLGNIHALIQGYKHSMVKKDAKILRLKASPPELAYFFQGGLFGSFLPLMYFNKVQGELVSLAANAGLERGLHMDRSEEQLDVALKKISHFMFGAQGRLLEATLLVATANYPFLSQITDRFAHPLSPSQNQNEEWVNAMVDTPNEDMSDATTDKAMEVIVQVFFRHMGRGTWYAKEHCLLLRAWGKPTIDAWVSNKHILSHATRLKPNGSPWDCSIAGQASTDLGGYVEPLSLNHPVKPYGVV
nr:hypothetical protein [Tanacetum cinerariifolium]